jgi:lambda repressor-like predicted transcriptional regulator
VALRGGSSNQSSRVRRLAEVLPTLLRRRLRATKVRARQVQRRLTSEQLVAEYQAGNDMHTLAADWHMHRTTIAAQLRRAGVALRRQGLSAAQLQEAVRLYGGGWSCQRLGERYGCGAETVRQALKRAGVRLRTPWERL